MIKRSTPLVVATALALALAGCSPRTTSSNVPTKVAKAGALTAAKGSAVKSLNLLSKIGAAGLKVRNNLKKQPAVANPRLARKATLSQQAAYRILAIDTVSQTNASGDVVIDSPDGQLDEAIHVTASASMAANDGVAGDVVAEVTESITTDTSSGQTGSESISDVEGSDGTIKAGEIAYAPDATASADGQVAEDIRFNVTGTDQASLSVTIAADPSDPTGVQTQASVSENEQPNGDVDVEGDLTLPTGERVHLVIAYHPDGAKDITCVGSGFSFAVTGVTPEGVGTGTLYDRDPSDPNAVMLGVITLNKGAQADTVAFFKADGTLGDTQTFKFLNS